MLILLSRAALAAAVALVLGAVFAAGGGHVLGAAPATPHFTDPSVTREAVPRRCVTPAAAMQVAAEEAVARGHLLTVWMDVVNRSLLLSFVVVGAPTALEVLFVDNCVVSARIVPVAPP